MKRKAAALVCALAVTTTFSGCGMIVQLGADKDGNVSVGAGYLMTDEELAEMSEGDDSMVSSDMVAGKTTIEGTEYNLVMASPAETIAKEDIKEWQKQQSESGEDTGVDFDYELLSQGYFGAEYTPVENNSSEEYAIDEETSEELAQMFLPFVIEVSLPDDAVACDSLGKKSGNKVVWTITSADVKSEEVYAYTAEFAEKHTAIVRGVKNDKTYSKPVKVKVNELMGFSISSITLDGKSVTPKAKKVTKIKVSSKGEHTLVVKNSAGNSKTVKFTLR